MRLFFLFTFALSSCSTSDRNNIHLCNTNKLNMFFNHDISIDIKNKKSFVFDASYALNSCSDTNIKCLYGNFSYLEPSSEFEKYSSITHLKNINYIENVNSLDVVEFDRVEGNSHTAYTYFFDDRKIVQFLYVVETSPLLKSSALYERC